MAIAPRLLYKYLSPDRIDVLQAGMIRLSQPASFNDPFESAPFISDLPQGRSLQDEVDDVHRAAARHAPVRPEDLLRAFTHSFGNVIGVLSLSEVPTSSLMWAHYAAQHEGLVIGLDSEHAFFRPRQPDALPDDPMTLDDLRPVKYAQARPAFGMEAVMGDDAPFAKSLEWSYEREWRLRKHKEGAASVLAGSGAFPIWLFELPPACVREVVVGCRMSQSSRKRLQTLLESTSKYRHVDLFQAWPHPREYGIRLIPISSRQLMLPRKKLVMEDVPEEGVQEVSTGLEAMHALDIDVVLQRDGLRTVVGHFIREA